MESTQPQILPKNWYDKSYKLLLIVPAILLILAISYLAKFYAAEGDVIRKDVSLTGGTTITVFDSRDILEVESALKPQFADMQIREISDVQSGAQRGFYLETSADVKEVKPALEKFLNYTLTPEISSIEFTGSALSSSFYQQLRLALGAAFVMMGIVVFLIFRTPIPSLAVIIAALADIIMTVAVVDIIGISLSTAGIIALLMLIGYSVDTDILLTSRVLKTREGTINQRIKGAFKTGILMTLTSLIAVSASLWFIGSYSETLNQMFTILLIGLGFDIFNTWITNASLIKWYAEARRIA